MTKVAPVDAVSLPVVSILSVTASADPDLGAAKAWVILNGAIIDTIEVSADRALGETQTFDIGLSQVLGTDDVVEFRFHNDLYRPNHDVDRNFYLHEVALDGNPLSLSMAEITAVSGSYDPAEGTIGLGSDGGAIFDLDEQLVQSIILLTATADLYNGDARAHILLNGEIIESIGVTADRSLGQTESFEIGLSEQILATDTLEIQFYNDVYTAGLGDKNLYITDFLVDGFDIDLSAVEITAQYGSYQADTDTVVLASNGGAIYDLALQDGLGLG